LHLPQEIDEMYWPMKMSVINESSHFKK